MTDRPVTEKKITAEQLDALGKFADTCDNLLAASKLPMPAKFHLDSLTECLRTMSAGIKELYVEIAGESPWE